MELREFVQKTIEQIFEGVGAAGVIAATHGGEIAPEPYGKVDRAYSHRNQQIYEIEFDVAVTVEKSGKGEAGIAVLSAGIKLGGGMATSSVSRVKFPVPVTYPRTESPRPRGS